MQYSDENYEMLRDKDVAGEPGTSHRGKMRKQCKPKGPVVYLLETLHLDAAVLDESKTIYQYNQPPLNIEHAPHQHLNPIIRQLAARNRTMRASVDREETMGLEEIDREVPATDKKDERSKLSNLIVHRTGSTWNRAGAFCAGQCDDQQCTLCGEKEAYDHILACKALQPDREKADNLIATIDATQLHVSIKCGIAPAMKVDPRKPFWGGDEQIACRETWSETLELKKLLGCEVELHIPEILKKITKDIDNHYIAREIVQNQIHGDDCKTILPPGRTNETAPKKINFYSDGSVKNPHVVQWRIGGIGVHWPERSLEEIPLTTIEEQLIRRKVEEGRHVAWNVYKDLQNSSIRTEVGTSLMAMQPRTEINVGIGNATTVQIGNAIIKHQIQREEVKLCEEDGSLRLGGRISKLHRPSPSNAYGNS